MKRILIAVVALFAMTCVVQATCSNETYADYIQRTLPSDVEVLTDGVAHIKFYYKGNRVDSFHVNRKFNRDLVVEPVTANTTLRGLRSTGYFHQKLQDYILFANCIYFNLEQNIPIGLLKIGEEYITGSVFNRSVLVIYDDKYRVSRASMNISANGVKVHNMNQPRMSKFYNLMYTSRWGQVAPQTPADGLQVQVTRDKVSRVSTNRLQIPQDGYVLVGLQKDLRYFTVGQEVKLSVDTIPSFPGAKYIVSGGPTILKNSETHVLAKEERMGAIGTGAYNRTFACVTQDDSLVISLSQGKNGLTLYDEAEIMKKFKCIDGLNFDGGSSTSGYYKSHDTYHIIADTKRLLPAVLVVRTSRKVK